MHITAKFHHLTFNHLKVYRVDKQTDKLTNRRCQNIQLAPYAMLLGNNGVCLLLAKFDDSECVQLMYKQLQQLQSIHLKDINSRIKC